MQNLQSAHNDALVEFFCLILGCLSRVYHHQIVTEATLMIPQRNPSDIAREALRQLAARKLPPTPMNYQESYNEIAHISNTSTFPEAHFRQIALELTARNPAQQEQLDLLDMAIGRGSWQGVEKALVGFCRSSAATSTNDEKTQSESSAKSGFSGEFLSKLAHMIESMLPALQSDDVHFSEQVVDLLHTLRDPEVDINIAQTVITRFSHRLSFAAEEQAEIKQALLKLLHLIIDNIGKLTLADSWLDGQIDALLNAVKPPLTLRRLDDVERRILDVMLKQEAAKERSLQAQEEMRQMLGAFIDRLAAMNDSSASFQNTLEESARHIEQINTIEDLAPLLKQVIGATRAMADETANARNQLNDLQEKVLATEAEIAKLHMELNSASASARHDPLTNALNRKGLDEALIREIANMRRKNNALSLALLDVDNFKKLNDRLGHKTGDEALIHLVKVICESLRPMDTLSRYGGEEFVILLPDSTLEEAIKAITRLQRELTKNFFLACNEKILITFSAGVAQLLPEESGADAIKRADQAMYLAKRSGKNRVLGG
jgi:diguanylate cyclase